MGKLTLGEQDRRGIAAIRELHSNAFATSRIAVNRRLGDEDVRLRSILAELDPTDASTVEAWEELVLCVVRSREQRAESERRRTRREVRERERDRVRDTATSGDFWRFSQQSGQPTPPPRRFFVEHEVDEMYPSRRNRPLFPLPRSVELDPELDPEVDGGTGQERDPLLDTFDPTDSHLVDVARPMPIINADEEWAFTGRLDDDDHPVMRPHLFDLSRSSPLPDAQPDDATRDPPTVLDLASPHRSRHGVTGRSRSTSPRDHPARSWLEEYTSASSNYVVSLGRRRREDESGPSTRRRLRHTDMFDIRDRDSFTTNSSGRDTRRDGIIFPSSVDGWLGSVLDRGSDDEGPAPAPGLVRTVSLSAVGGSDRPVARLPRRPASMLRAD